MNSCTTCNSKTYPYDRIGLQCKDCFIIDNEKIELDRYFDEKYN